MEVHTKYKPEYAEIAAEYSAKGATGRTLAAVLGVHENTICEWKKRHPEFGQAMERACAIADHEVASSLYRQAIGYEYQTEESKVVKDKDGNERLEVVTVTKRVPPKTQAAQFWLKNRQPQLWREKTELDVGSTSLDALLGEVMNTSRGLPGENPSTNSFLRRYGGPSLNDGTLDRPSLGSTPHRN